MKIIWILPRNEFSKSILHQSLQGCSDCLSNSANPRRPLRHAIRQCSGPKSTLSKACFGPESERKSITVYPLNLCCCDWLTVVHTVATQEHSSYTANIGLNLRFNCKIRVSSYTTSRLICRQTRHFKISQFFH